MGVKYKGIFKVANNIRQVVRNVFDIRASKAGSTNPQNPAYWLQKFFSGGETWTGNTVDENTALEYVAFWTCFKIIIETIASLPIILYKRTSEGKKRATNHGAYQVLHLRANPEQTAYDFKEMSAGHYILYCNAYAEKVYDNKGQLKELWPLLPWKMTPKRVAGKKYYFYELPDQTIHTFLPDEILHISNFTRIGLKGERQIDFNKQAIGMGLASEEFGARFFSNDAMPGGIIEMEKSLKGDAQKRFEASWNAGGALENKHRTRILEEGAKFHELTVTPDKAQFLETRKFQRSLMTSFHRIPPHMAGDLEHATYTNIEHQSLEFVKYTMLPHFVRWEQNYTIQTLLESELKKYYFEILVDALTRADINTRYQAYKTGREAGFLSPDDIREMENMNKLPGGIGNVYHVPLNWVELGAKTDQNQSLDDGKNDKKDEKDATKEEKKLLSIVKEQRTLRHAMTRKNIAISYQKIHSDIISRILRKEIKDVKKGVKKWLIERTKEDFDKWYKEYYDNLPEYMRSRLMPVYNSINQAIYAEVRDEIKAAERQEEQQEFVNEYLDSYILRYTKQSKRDIGFAVHDALTNERDIEERMEEMYLSWENNFGTDSKNEVIRSSNAFAKYAYLLGGIQFLRWVNTGGNPCPWCQQMDGRTVGIQESFVTKGSILEDGQNKMNINSNIGHGPLHGGCECQVMAG